MAKKNEGLEIVNFMPTDIKSTENDDTEKSISESFSKISALIRSHKFDAAEAEISLLNLPDHHLTFGYRGELLMTKKLYSEAIIAFSKAIKLNFEQHSYYFARGDCHLFVDKGENAISDFQMALRLAPDNPIYTGRIGYGLFRLNRHEESIIAYTKAIGIDPANRFSILGRAHCRESMEDYHAALGDYRAVVKIYPTDIYARYRRGYLNWFFHNYKKATRDFRYIIRRNNQDSASLSMLASCLCELGKFDQGFDVFEKSLQINPTDIFTLDYYGWYQARKANFEKAIACYERLLEIDPYDDICAFQLVNLLLEEKKSAYFNSQRAHSLALMINSQTDYTIPNYLAVLAKAERVRNNFDGAVALIKKAILNSDTEGDEIKEFEKTLTVYRRLKEGCLQCL